MLWLTSLSRSEPLFPAVVQTQTHNPHSQNHKHRVKTRLHYRFSRGADQNKKILMCSIRHRSIPWCHRPSISALTIPPETRASKQVCATARRSASGTAEQSRWAGESGGDLLSVGQRAKQMNLWESMRTRKLFPEQKHTHTKKHYSCPVPKKMSVPINMCPRNMLTEKWVGQQHFYEWATVWLDCVITKHTGHYLSSSPSLWVTAGSKASAAGKKHVERKVKPKIALT